MQFDTTGFHLFKVKNQTLKMTESLKKKSGMRFIFLQVKKHFFGYPRKWEKAVVNTKNDVYTFF